ncbi:MAG: ADP-ribosylglycohydrolase family protein [Chloroflexi bacterium]|nr:ADP-ribosylglycohydrolase family protein [Chloroflexota bacterium]
MAQPQLSRIEGTVLGAAIGDAMGHPTEFISSFDAIFARYPPAGVERFELYWDQDGEHFAPYTDDTQMAEVVLRALIQGRAGGDQMDPVMQAIAEGFITWMDHPQGGHRAPGNACMAGTRNLAKGVPWRLAGGETAGGCGSVMRSYPFGLVFADDVAKAEDWAVNHSRLTHRDPIAFAACATMAVAVAALLNGESPGSVLGQMPETAAKYSADTATMIAQATAEAVDGTPPRTTLQRLQGWAAHEAIAAAAYVFARNAGDARTAILEAANTPGDSDSIATLVGALVGAHLGIDALPADWIADVERSAELRDLAHAAWGCLGSPVGT